MFPIEKEDNRHKKREIKEFEIMTKNISKAVKNDIVSPI
ncbi:MAG: hypothetical protein AB199_01470 [Parcubacteria bacterium C7867-004]|nr:MAG: hypothetical protein AB199_01470 [Parcubacteria bacterium C7867-004]